MCWACEQDRFWVEYAKYMAAKQAAAEAVSSPADEVPARTTGEEAPSLALPQEDGR